MNEHVTLMHPDARDPTARGISSGFPVDLLSQSAGRLRVLALLYAFVFFMAGIFPALLFPSDRARFLGSFVQWGPGVIGIGVALLVDEQRYPDPDHAGAPLHEASEEPGPIAREQQRRKDSGHEEDKRVQQGEDAEASGRLAEQIDRESRRDPSSGRVTRVRVHESEVLVHAEAPNAPATCESGSRWRSNTTPKTIIHNG